MLGFGAFVLAGVGATESLLGSAPPPLYCELTDKWAKTAVTQEDNPA